MEALELFNIPVVSITGDGAKSNRRFYKICQTNKKKTSVPYKSINPFQKNRDLYFFSDAPHLLKTARNCFSNSFAHSCSRKMQVNTSNYVDIASITCPNRDGLHVGGASNSEGSPSVHCPCYSVLRCSVCIIDGNHRSLWFGFHRVLSCQFDWVIEGHLLVAILCSDMWTLTEHA